MSQDQQQPEDADAQQQAYRKKLEEYQKQQQQDGQIKSLLKQILDAPAYERLQNIKLSNPEFYYKIAQLLVMLQQQGKLRNRVDEQALKALVAKLLGSKREGTIKFERK